MSRSNASAQLYPIHGLSNIDLPSKDRQDYYLLSKYFHDSARDGISGASAVVQLIATHYDIGKFLRSLHDARSELLEIADSRPGRVQQNMAEVQDFVHQQTSCALLPNSQRISSAMKVCESRFGVLAKLVDVFTISLNYQSLMQRRLAAMKLFTEKDQIRKFQIQLRESTWSLLTAPVIN